MDLKGALRFERWILKDFEISNLRYIQIYPDIWGTTLNDFGWFQWGRKEKSEISRSFAKIAEFSMFSLIPEDLAGIRLIQGMASPKSRGCKALNLLYSQRHALPGSDFWTVLDRGFLLSHCSRRVVDGVSCRSSGEGEDRDDNILIVRVWKVTGCDTHDTMHLKKNIVNLVIKALVMRIMMDLHFSKLLHWSIMALPHAGGE